MAIELTEISYFEWSEHFRGRDIYNKKTDKKLQKWEAYHTIKNFWEMVITNTHIQYGVREKGDFKNGKYTGRRLKAVQYK